MCVLLLYMYVVVFFLVGHRASTRAATLHLFDQNYTKCHPWGFSKGQSGRNSIDAKDQLDFDHNCNLHFLLTSLWERCWGWRQGMDISFHVGRWRKFSGKSNHTRAYVWQHLSNDGCRPYQCMGTSWMVNEGSCVFDLWLGFTLKPYRCLYVTYA